MLEEIEDKNQVDVSSATHVLDILEIPRKDADGSDLTMLGRMRALEARVLEGLKLLVRVKEKGDVGDDEIDAYVGLWARKGQ